MIKTFNLRKIYKADSVATVALDNVSLSVRKGEMIAITGPSGCGKSTLLNILGMIDQPDEGEYFFNEFVVSQLSEKNRAKLRKENIGFIFQSFNLINELTIYENVELPLLYTDISGAERKARVYSLLENLKIAHRGKHYPQQLSGGQQQRVAVARAIANRPELILADEPTGNLDTRNGDEVMKQLLRLNEEGTTVIIVTHSHHYAQFCNRTIKLLDGRILGEEAKPALYA
jgi:putative ABC transport system ATP-binding protein